MADYSPTMVNEIDVRNFFTPPLDFDDISKAEVLLKIEAVEKYVNAYWEVTTSNDGRIACLLLIASKIIQDPKLAKKYYTLSSEVLGDYEYTLAQPISRGTDVQSSPFVISITWEKMALRILNAVSTNKWKIRLAND